MAVKTNLGRVGLVPRGAYSPSESYARLDIVTHEGSCYAALTDLRGVTPGTDETRWQLLASRGEQGLPGARGGIAIAQGAPYEGVNLFEKFQSEIDANHGGDGLQWLKQRIAAWDVADLYIGDWFPITCKNGTTLSMQIAGIDNYRGYGNPALQHHIDFVSKELWSDLVSFNATNTNAGYGSEKVPWLCSNAYAYLNSLAMTVAGGTSVDYTSGGVYSQLPEALQAMIVPKQLMEFLTATSWQMRELGKLWLPSEVEVMGTQVFGTVYRSGFQIPYPLFAHNAMSRVKFGGPKKEATSWWTTSAATINSTDFCSMHYSGYTINNPAVAKLGVPVCFRLAP